MNKIDAVIILGGGAKGDLKPILYTKERLEYFAKLKNKFKDTPIVVSGGYSIWLKKKPKYTEAEVMANYLRKVGFKNIILEPNSRDTVGNIYFSKLIANTHPEWKNLLVVTTKGHKFRSRWLFKQFFGPRYSVKYLEVPTLTGHFGSKKRQLYEKFVTGQYKKMFGQTKLGDDKSIYKILTTSHPAFTNSKKAQAVAKSINDAKQFYLGFVDPHNKSNVPR
jgi:uncharacterized SAM-binding protein YcdF (DUF218 family)